MTKKPIETVKDIEKKYQQDFERWQNRMAIWIMLFIIIIAIYGIVTVWLIW